MEETKEGIIKVVTNWKEMKLETLLHEARFHNIFRRNAQNEEQKRELNRKMNFFSNVLEQKGRQRLLQVFLKPSCELPSEEIIKWLLEKQAQVMVSLCQWFSQGEKQSLLREPNKEQACLCHQGLENHVSVCFHFSKHSNPCALKLIRITTA